MMQSVAALAKRAGFVTGAMMLAAAVLLPVSAHAQAQNGLSNLFGGIFSGSNPAPSQPAPGPGGALPWTGEDGASGHPLMTAAAIREAASNFNNCVAGMWPDAARRNITQENFQRFTAGLSPDLRIMDLMDSQPEFTKSIWDYLDILVNDNRLAKGREVLAKYKPQFDATEKATGVDRYIIASIWGHQHPAGPRHRPKRRHRRAVAGHRRTRSPLPPRPPTRRDDQRTEGQ